MAISRSDAFLQPLTAILSSNDASVEQQAAALWVFDAMANSVSGHNTILARNAAVLNAVEKKLASKQPKLTNPAGVRARTCSLW
jgi:hypothetical protein